MSQINRWDGHTYKNNSSLQQRRALEKVYSLSFRGDESILDIGCGNGAITRVIKDLLPNGRVVGIDISNSMITQAKQDFGTVEDLDFQIQDAQSFQFDEPFDLIVSFAALHWVEDHEKVLDCVRKSLKKGGKIVFLMPAGRAHPIYDAAIERFPLKEHLDYVESVQKRMRELDYDALLQKKSFTILKHTIYEDTHLFESKDRLEQHLLTVLTSVSDLDADACQPLVDDIVKMVEKAEHGYSWSMAIRHVEAIQL